MASKGRSRWKDRIWILKQASEVSDDDSKLEVLSRVAQATGALTNLKPIWRDSYISLGSKVILVPCHLHISVCLWTMDIDGRAWEKSAGLWDDRKANEEVRSKIQAASGEYDELLIMVKKRELRWFCHVSRSSGLAKTILQGTVNGKKKKK